MKTSQEPPSLRARGRGRSTTRVKKAKQRKELKEPEKELKEQLEEPKREAASVIESSVTMCRCIFMYFQLICPNLQWIFTARSGKGAEEGSEKEEETCRWTCQREKWGSLRPKTCLRARDAPKSPQSLT